MKKTLLALAVLAFGGLTAGTATAAPLGRAGSASIVEPGSNVQLAHGWHHHHGFFRGGIFVIPVPGGGSCYDNCRAYHGPRYCHARCDY